MDYEKSAADAFLMDKIERAIAAAVAKERQRCAETGRRDEIEITPEMIEAGSALIYAWFGDVISQLSETGRDLAIEVYRAMRNARGPTPRLHAPSDDR